MFHISSLLLPRPSSSQLQLLSPETVLPPPPSPPCTCGKMLGEMGPPPLLQPPDWDTQSNDSRYTEESKLGFEAGPPPHGSSEGRKSRNFSSLAAGSTYMIDATGADPVLLQGQDLAEHYRSGSAGHQMFGYSGLERQGREVEERTPLCDYPGEGREGRNGRVVQPGRDGMNGARGEGWDTLREGFDHGRQGR